MDNEFPSPLFSSFFNDGPPDQKRAGNIGGWRSYNHVLGVSVTGCGGDVFCLSIKHSLFSDGTNISQRGISNESQY